MLSNQRQLREQAKFEYSPLGKTLEKQTEKQVGSLKSLDTFNEKNELKQIEGIFRQNLMNDLIRVKLKQIVNSQYIIKKDNINYKSKRGNQNLVNIHYLLLFKEIYMKVIYH